jgi:hypothetical protein
MMVSTNTAGYAWTKPWNCEKPVPFRRLSSSPNGENSLWEKNVKFRVLTNWKSCYHRGIHIGPLKRSSPVDVSLQRMTVFRILFSCSICISLLWKTGKPARLLHPNLLLSH